MNFRAGARTQIAVRYRILPPPPDGGSLCVVQKVNCTRQARRANTWPALAALEWGQNLWQFWSTVGIAAVPGGRREGGCACCIAYAASSRSSAPQAAQG